MTDLEIKSVPQNLSEYTSALNYALHLQENDGWKDYLLSVGDTVALVSLLVGNGVGNFMILEPEDYSSLQRWIWMGPTADSYAQQHLPKLFASVHDASNLDVQAVYAGILKDLHRDSRGRKIRAANVVA